MLYREYRLNDTGLLNNRLFRRFQDVSESGRVRQTHHFAGRFENTYVDIADIPEMGEVLSVFLCRAGQWLGISPDELHGGFWFNAMGPEHVTMPHHHDENDELLSAVYYIRVPDNSGELILYEDERRIAVQPEEGKLVMFDPAIMHEVTVNNSPELRLSVAMNAGPAAGHLR